MSDDNPQPAKPSASPPPSGAVPRGPRLGYIIVVLVVAGLMLWLGISQGDAIRSGLAKIVGTGSHPAADANAAAVQWWTCGMHPQVMLPKPGDCPICHMKLVPYKPSDANALKIDSVISQEIGVRITDVTTGPLTRVIRTVGTVETDETTVRDLTVKVGGWIEKLYVNYVGEPVAVGQPLFDIYSPDLYTAQQEYLNTYRTVQGAATAPAAGKDGGWGADLLEAARKRLEYYDISPAQIAELERTGKASKTMTIKSPYRGLVLTKNVFEGAKVDSGAGLYRIADLSRVWVIVTLYENQLPFVQVGLKATMTLPYIPGQPFEGTVTYIYPVLNTEARQARMRVEVDNPALLLKPGMYANVELHSTLAQNATLVPREAVIDTGERKIAFVSLGEGRFEPRNVSLEGETEGGMVQVIDGLKPGEKVVTSGQFLLDSEARLAEARAKMIRGTLAADQKTAAATAGAAELSSLPPEAAKQITAILDGYFAVGQKLSGDTLDGVAEPARQAASAADTLVTVGIPDSPHFWHEHVELAQVGGKAQELAGDANLASAREHFADMSNALSKLLHATGVPAGYGREVQEMHCPMYRQGQGGNVWLQPAGAVRNPFFGSAMLECSDRQAALPVSGAAGAVKEPAATAAPAPAPSPVPATKPAGRIPISAEVAVNLQDLLGPYFAISDSLASDTMAAVGDQAIKLGAAAEALVKTNQKQKVLGAGLADAPAAIAAQAKLLTANTDIVKAREVFADISRLLIPLTAATGVPATLGKNVLELHCPMYRQDKGGESWLQPDGEVRNPYFGKTMLGCFDKKSKLPPATVERK